jgi:hypothetical protein
VGAYGVWGDGTRKLEKSWLQLHHERVHEMRTYKMLVGLVAAGAPSVLKRYEHDQKVRGNLAAVATQERMSRTYKIAP